MLCFEAGKAVLCEKALTMNLADTETLVAEARSRGLFFAEAMWMRANPNIRRIAELAARRLPRDDRPGAGRAGLRRPGRRPLACGIRSWGRVRCSTSASTR